MKKDIHPKYNNKSEVNCACGAKFVVGSTMDKLNIEICSQCHPFFTGNDKVLDTAGRVDRFKKRAAVATKKVIKTKK